MPELALGPLPLAVGNTCENRMSQFRATLLTDIRPQADVTIADHH